MILKNISTRNKPRRSTSRALFWVVLAAVLLAGAPQMADSAPLAQSAYPQSPVIAGVSFDWSTHRQEAPGSDNWPLTWAADDHQYTSFGDGGGFGGTDSDSRASLGVARIEGSPDGYTGYNIWGGKNAEHPAQFDGKSYGILAVDGALYMWVSPGSDANNYDEMRMARSTDRGATWTRAGWAFSKGERLVLPTILQFGKEYSGARDHYVYTYAIRLADSSSLKVQKPGQIDLLRAPKDRLMERDAYEFFAGLDGSGNPNWTRDINARRPVFEDANGVGWNVSVSYNAGLGRYILATEHGESFKGNLGLFDAPEPWGPWTTVAYWNNWGSGHIETSTFFWTFSNKWTSDDGQDFTMVFSGINNNDSWNSVRGAFKLGGTAQDLRPSIFLPLAFNPDMN